ncbi:HlyD family secretion protein [Ereboglobus sp. PH5-5]|uniref:efflux RND transporter periplasmic adaptor subunit n=1 Tax=Ereboglobus sp. PH5-5 TaxID=2940529 RepID=UPI0024077250|nr:efflux RND transporter periplasmic adaptor subunit [Ereboglobus sp. PH5-5]MDF9833257.1 HlyD family secretion protein [Ereboglobus sp. PH5-5]
MSSPASPSSSAPNQTVTRPSATRPRRKSRKGLLLLVSGLVVVVLVIAAVAAGKRGPKAQRVTVEPAIIKTITQIVSATGKIQPETEVKISPEVAGEILELPFREGAYVKKGDLLAQIKADNYRFQVEQREAALASARASAADAQVQLIKTEDDLKRAEGLYKTNLISESDFIATKALHDRARANLDAANASINSSEGLLNQAKDQLDKTTIYSPIDGTISSRTSEVGERVVGTGQFAGTEMMRVADLTNMEVRVDINENDIVNVKVGDKARVTIDAFPGRKFDAVVKEIGSAAKTTGSNTQEEVTNFQVKIRILDKDIPIRPGMSANADVETQTVENVVAVPIQSVTVRSREGSKTMDQLAADRARKSSETKGEGAATAVNTRDKRLSERNDRESLDRVVFVLEGAKVKMVPVETGIADTTHMEIKTGVKEGDKIVSGSYAAITRILRDGMDVVEDARKPGKK